MSDTVTIRGIRGTGYHGVFDHERTDGQEFVVDVALALDTSVAAGSDALSDTVDYGQVASDVHALIGAGSIELGDNGLAVGAGQGGVDQLRGVVIEAEHHAHAAAGRRHAIDKEAVGR